MSAPMLIMLARTGVLLLVVIALCYRLWKLRQVGGTAAILFCFACLYLSTAGGGPISVDAMRKK